MTKTITTLVLCLYFITGCASSQKKQDDPVRAELLKPAEVETADTEQNLDSKSKETDESKGIAYYLYVGAGAVFYTGIYVLDEIVRSH
ncbi:hypothetical protein SAMN02910357_01175 [Succinivibrio dextrinosolvens]|uniref:hypothetical protein n=1 Tax=Succinivibrio dextrinosolvens TaxID=83771 RepID=UPI0008E04E86|nr:hypothetical protein [Succinivibrio dextrinosolvens]SFS51071.1 hypothetical protein SAMN02910357_01175 [Succinivibrio dextrinosolvens]